MKDKVQEIDNQIRDKLAHYISQLAIFSAIFFIILIVSGVWHAILTKNLNNDFFKKIAGETPFAISISICSLSFGSLLVIFILLTTLYFYGNLFNLHFTIAAVCVFAVLSNIVLTAVNLGFVTPTQRDKYIDSIQDLISNNSTDKVVVAWMKKYKCTNITTCEPYIKPYVTLRCTGELIACSVMLILSLIAILGIAITVILMGKIKRPLDDDQVRNLSEYQSPEEQVAP